MCNVCYKFGIHDNKFSFIVILSYPYTHCQMHEHFVEMRSNRMLGQWSCTKLTSSNIHNISMMLERRRRRGKNLLLMLSLLVFYKASNRFRYWQIKLIKISEREIEFRGNFVDGGEATLIYIYICSPRTCIPRIFFSSISR